MKKHQTVLVDLLSHEIEVKPAIQEFSEAELAELFFSTSFLVTAMQFLKEEHWIQNKSDPNQEFFKDFIIEIFKSELSPILFLQTFFESSSVGKSKDIGKKADHIENLTIELIKSKTYPSQKAFATHALHLMSTLFEFEIELRRKKKVDGLHLGISFYRTFDRLDEIFNLNYNADHGMMAAIENTERVYAGAGVGVQSGYSTVLTALANLNLQRGARVVDLGSGYGRVGLIIGLMREDIDFKGYEFVQHRVDIATRASQNLDMESHVCFYTCDLSRFQVPDAEVYYMYDPFSDETYIHVLSQLIAISRRQKITIVTKGNARSKLMDVAHSENWPPHLEFDDGNLCLFRT